MYIAVRSFSNSLPHSLTAPSSLLSSSLLLVVPPLLHPAVYSPYLSPLYLTMFTEFPHRLSVACSCVHSLPPRYRLVTWSNAAF
jgi:hypothetical protein